ncbi:MAG: isoprenylcysteine carboxylmethyltransferase family protein [Solirubrobacterales bacterium]
MHTSPLGVLIMFIVVFVPQWFDYLIVARVSQLKVRELSGDREMRQIGMAMIGSVWLAAAVGWFLTPLALPGSGWTWLIVGLLVMCSGVALRYWSILTLGRFFRFVVDVQDDHRVITSGPYRLVRHPAYTGLVLIQLGFGIATGNILSAAICLAVPIIGLIPRIQHEEEALEGSLGAEYRGYAAHTKRLIPLVW